MKRLITIGLIISLFSLLPNHLTFASDEPLKDKFAGLSWGIKPKQVAGLSPVSPGVPPYQLYRMKPDPMDPIFGKAGLLILVFNPEMRFVQGWLSFPKDSVPLLLLWGYLGPQVMIEPLPGHPVKPTWFPGENTRVEEYDEGFLFTCRSESNFLDGASILRALKDANML